MGLSHSHSRSRRVVREACEAIWQGDEGRVQKLLQSEQVQARDLNHLYPRHQASASLVGPCTPLMAAVIRGSLTCVRLLLSAGVDPDIRNARGETALHLAVLHAKEVARPSLDDSTAALPSLEHTIVQQLLEGGADPDKLTHQGNSPLFLAASGNHFAITLALIDGGGSLVTQNNFGETALHQVINSQPAHVDRVALQLVALGAALDIPDWSGETPLIAAASKNNTEVALALIRAGANVNTVDNTKHSALDFAIEQDNLVVVAALLARGVDDRRLLYGFNAHNQRVDIDAADLFGFGSPITLIDTAPSDDMARLLLRATCAAVRWARRKHFVMFLSCGGFLSYSTTVGPDSVAVSGAVVTATTRVFDIADLTRYISLFL
mmetsp:Transcript_12838/g.23759  ORF Transcript_12838/g.23759 Transcript_12838/m.23759 type:complete len:379 (+) Transcript_12838:267-1403(+)